MSGHMWIGIETAGGTRTSVFEVIWKRKGEGLLSYDQIHAILGTRLQSIWSVTDDAERYGAWQRNPLVYAPKTDV